YGADLGAFNPPPPPAPCDKDRWSTACDPGMVSDFDPYDAACDPFKTRGCKPTESYFNYSPQKYEACHKAAIQDFTKAVSAKSGAPATVVFMTMIQSTYYEFIAKLTSNGTTYYVQEAPNLSQDGTCAGGNVKIKTEPF